MKRELLPLLLLTFVNILNFAIMIPVLPFIVESFGGGSIMYGILLSMYPLFQFFAAPLLGAWSDVRGRRPVLLISQAGTLFSWVIFAVSYFIPHISIGPVLLPFIVILFARIFDGITGGNNSVANAFLADVTKPHERAKTFGLLGGVVGVGLIVGPAIGGFTSSWGIGYLGTSLANMVLSTITLILMYLYLPESLPPSKRDASLHFKWKDELKFITKIKKYATTNRLLRYLFVMRFAFLLFFNGYASIVVLFLIDQFHLNQTNLGLVFLVTGSYLVLNQVVISPFISSKIGPLRTFVIGVAVFITSLFFIQSMTNIWIYLLFAYILSLGISMSFPTYKSLLSNNVEETKQGEIQGIDEAFLAGASAIAPVISGIIYAGVGKYSFSIFAIGLFIPLAGFVTRYKRK